MEDVSKFTESHIQSLSRLCPIIAGNPTIGQSARQLLDKGVSLV